MKISIWKRRDTEGNLCPIIHDGATYPFIGELTHDHHILVTAFGKTDGEVYNQLREEWLIREGRL